MSGPGRAWPTASAAFRHNDGHGNQRGDAVPVEAAEAIRRSLRPTELVYRVARPSAVAAA